MKVFKINGAFVWASNGVAAISAYKHKLNIQKIEPFYTPVTLDFDEVYEKLTEWFTDEYADKPYAEVQISVMAVIKDIITSKESFVILFEEESGE